VADEARIASTIERIAADALAAARKPLDASRAQIEHRMGMSLGEQLLETLGMTVITEPLALGLRTSAMPRVQMQTAGSVPNTGA
jgi:hypothetical protein